MDEHTARVAKELAKAARLFGEVEDRDPLEVLVVWKRAVHAPLVFAVAMIICSGPNARVREFATEHLESTPPNQFMAEAQRIAILANAAV